MRLNVGLAVRVGPSIVTESLQKPVTNSMDIEISFCGNND